MNIFNDGLAPVNSPCEPAAEVARGSPDARPDLELDLDHEEIGAEDQPKLIEVGEELTHALPTEDTSPPIRDCFTVTPNGRELVALQVMEVATQSSALIGRLEGVAEGPERTIVLSLAGGMALAFEADDDGLARLVGASSAMLERQARSATVEALRRWIGVVLPLMRSEGGADWTLDHATLCARLRPEAPPKRARGRRRCICSTWVAPREPINWHPELRLVAGCKTCVPGLDGNKIKPPTKDELKPLVNAAARRLAYFGLPLADTADARDAARFANAIQAELRYVRDAKSWAAWDGTRWEITDLTTVRRLLIHFWSEAKTQALASAGAAEDEGEVGAYYAFAAHAERRLDKRGLDAVLALLSSYSGLWVFEATFDGPATALLLNTKNGTIDLQTGVLRPHRREDWITMRLELNFDPAAACPRWLRLLEDSFGGDDAYVGFFHRMYGYSLSGLSTEEKMFIFFDTKGGTGKSTQLRTMRALLGPYGHNIEPSTFDANAREVIRSDIMRLKGGRFAMVNEPARAMVLDEGMIKKLVSGEEFTGRVRYGDEYEFTATTKLFMLSNYLPRVVGEEQSIWDRLWVVPFWKRFRGTDADDDKLRENLVADELPGILAWAVAGCLEWQRLGLDPPERVIKATADFRFKQGGFERWLEEACILDREHSPPPNPPSWTATSDLHDSYLAWSARHGCEADAIPAFAARLGSIDGIEPGRGRVDGRQQRGWRGIRLRADEPTGAPLLL